MRKTATRWGLMLVSGLCMAGLLQAATVAQATRVGVVYDEDPGLPGTLQAVPRQLASGELLKTLDAAAVVRLDNGRVLKLSPNSSIRVEAATDSNVTVTVFSGRIGLVDPAGRTLTAGSRSSFSLSPSTQDADAAEARLLEVDLSVREPRDAELRRALSATRAR